MKLSSLSFVKSTINDFELLRSIHKSSMHDKVVNSIGFWDEEKQKQRLYNNFINNVDTLFFIYYKKQIVGSFNLHLNHFHDGDFLLLEHFYLLPNFQGNGIGTFIFKDVVRIHDKKIRLSVLKKDSLACSFYIKNGFKEYSEDEFQKYFQINF